MIRPYLCCLLGLVLVIGCGGDSGGESTRDASVDDGGADSGSDGGNLGLECWEVFAAGGGLGGQCRGDTFECNGNLECLGEVITSIGGPDDPIRDFPQGEDQSFDVPLWPGNYCTLALTASPGTCDIDDADACADVCGVCTPLFIDADICLRGCVAEANTTSTCRPGYQCDLLFEACDMGCVSDDDCRVFREDTNDNGEFDPWDPDTLTGDRLVYDTTSTFVCNPATNRCEHPGKPGTEAGAVCENAQQCEPDGSCLDEDFFEWPTGYCTKLRCDIAGRECAGDGVCTFLGFGVPMCAEGCTVGAGATEGEPSTYLNNTQGCRVDYTCFWSGGAGPDGACVPGSFNAVTFNNVGADCAENDECYSPFGQGVCGNGDFVCALFGEPEGSSCAGFGCTVLDCGAPGMPSDVCGDDATCVALSETFSLCLETCSTAEDCLPGAACADVDLDPATPDSVCFPFCLDTTECRAGEVCDITGRCVP